MFNSYRDKLVAGTLWTLIGHVGLISINLVTNIFLARLLSPEEFGRLGIIMFFIALARVLSESGLGGALVRNKNAQEIDYQTIFIFNLFVSVLLNILLIFLSNPISNFYADPELRFPLIVSSFILIINAFQFVQNAKTLKKGLYRERAIYEIIATIIGSSIAISLASRGLGIWSLISHQIITSLVLTGLFIYHGDGIKKFSFQLQSLSEHIKYGVNTTASSLVNAFFENIYQALLGKYFSISYTGNYFQAKKFQAFFGGILNKLFLGVFFSELSQLQDNKLLFKKSFSIILKYITFILGFCTFFVFVFANEIIEILLGSMWIKSAYFLKMLILVGFFQIQEQAFRMLFKIFNKTFFLLILDLLKKALILIVIVLGIYFMNIEILMTGLLIVSFIGYVLNVYFTSKFLSISLKEDFFNVLKVILSGFIIFITYTNFLTQFSFGVLFAFTTLFYTLLGIIFGLVEIKEIKTLLSNNNTVRKI